MDPVSYSSPPCQLPHTAPHVDNAASMALSEISSAFECPFTESIQHPLPKHYLIFLASAELWACFLHWALAGITAHFTLLYGTLHFLL